MKVSFYSRSLSRHLHNRRYTTPPGDPRIAQLVLTLQKMRNDGFRPDEFIYTKIISTLAQSKDIEHVEEYFQKMVADGIKPSEINYSILIKLYASVNDLEKALNIFEQMSKEGHKPDSYETYSYVILGFARKGDFIGFRRILNELFTNPKLRPNNYQLNCLYSVLINACRIQKNIDSCLEIYRELLTRESFTIDSFLYALLVNAFSLSTDTQIQTDQVREIITRTEELRVIPNASTFLLMHYCLKESTGFDQISTIYRFFEMLISLYDMSTHDEPILGPKEIELVSNQVNTCLKREEFYESMKSKSKSELTEKDLQIKNVFTKIMSLFTKLKMHEEAFNLLKQMIKLKLYPSLEHYRVCD